MAKINKRRQELKKLDISQLKTLEKDLLVEQKKLRFDMVLSAVENPAKITEIRREIATIKTFIKEIESGKRQPK